MSKTHNIVSNYILHPEEMKPYRIILNIEVAPTWVMIKYDIKKVLVTPGDIEFVLLEKRHQHFLPLQWNGCHVILEGGNTKTIAQFQG